VTELAVIILCGPPGAGKSTIANRLANELRNAHILSTDQLKRNVYSRILIEVGELLGKFDYLILDGTFYKKEYRDKVALLVGGREVVLLVHVDCPLRVCQERNSSRESPVSSGGVYSIWKIFERPDRPDVYVDSTKIEPGEAAGLIVDTLKAKEIRCGS